MADATCLTLLEFSNCSGQTKRIGYGTVDGIYGFNRLRVQIYNRA